MKAGIREKSLWRLIISEKRRNGVNENVSQLMLAKVVSSASSGNG
jgi:hypothetical protein